MEDQSDREFDASRLDADELTDLLDALPHSWERLEQARADIRDGRTFPLEELGRDRAHDS